MTATNDPRAVQPLIAGRPASSWLAEHRAELVDRALVGLGRVEPRSAAERAQLRWIVEVNLNLFMRSLADLVAVDETTAADLVASAAGRANEGSSVEDLLQDYLGAAAAVWRGLADQVLAEDISGLVDLTSRLFDYLGTVVGLVLRGVDHAAADATTGERDARFTVYSTLLTDAGQAAAVAARSGMVLADRYAVLALRLGPDGDDPVPGRRAAVPRLRRAATVRRLLGDLAHGDVLAHVGDRGGTALVPFPADRPDDEAVVREWTDRVSAALGVPVWVAVAVVGVDAVPEASKVSTEVLRLVEATGLAPGTWTLDDVVVPYQLTRPGPARDRLAARVAALDAHPDWEATLRAYVAAGADRRIAAQVLHVHPNTVDYRLTRAATLCGFDATDPVQRPLVMAALAVLDLDRHDRSNGPPPSAAP